MGSMLSHMSFEWAIVAGVAGVVVYGYAAYSKSNRHDYGAPTGGKAATKDKKKRRKIQTPKTAFSELSEKSVSTTTASPTAAVTTTPTTQGSPVPGPGPVVIPLPRGIMPGEFETTSGRDAHAMKSKGKKKKQKTQEQEATLDVGQQASHSGGHAIALRGSRIAMHSKSLKGEEEELHIRSSSPSLDTDPSWTPIDHHGNQTARPRGTELKAALTRSGNNTDAITTELNTGDDVGPFTGDLPITERMNIHRDAGSVPITVSGTSRGDSNHRTLAEKLLPKPRKTAVDDMLEHPDYPGLTRVMRVQARADEVQASGFSWKDHEDDSNPLGDGNGEGEWGVVKSRSRLSSKNSVVVQQVAPRAPEQLTQKQRQNAKRNQLLKAAKAEAEAERLAKLAERRRTLERERIIEQSRPGASKATVDSRGKLVYD